MRLLDGLHPYVLEAATEFAHRAYAAGIPIKFISGYRAWKPRDWRSDRVRNVSSWHAWGVSFDFNLVARRTMRDALSSYARDEASWKKLARILRQVGLYWGGEYRRSEVFHVEWHPGYGGRIKKEEFPRFLKLAGPDGGDYRKVWVLFEPPDR